MWERRVAVVLLLGSREWREEVELPQIGREKWSKGVRVAVRKSEVKLEA